MDDQTLKALAEYANEVSGAFPGERVKYNKRDWTQAAAPVDPGERFVLFVRTIFKRQDRWKDKKIVETNVAFLGEKLKPLDELQPPKEEWELDRNGKPKPPWSETHFIGGIRERDGLLIHFASSSDGGRKAIGAVAQAVVQTNAKHPGKAPVVELGEDFYIHSNPQFGKVYYPVFLIVDWVDPPEAAPALTQHGAQDAADRRACRRRPQRQLQRPP